MLLLETMVPDENELKLCSLLLKLLCAHVGILKESAISGGKSNAGFAKKKIRKYKYLKEGLPFCAVFVKRIED